MSIYHRFVSAAASLDRRVPIVVVFADAAYARLLENWLVFAGRAGARNVLVGALDEEVAAVATRSGVDAVLLHSVASSEELWLLRMKIFAALAGAGIDFVHSDVDAIWLGSPLPELFRPDVDITFSPGTIWPRDIVEAWGFVVCCGLFGARGTAATAAFFAEATRRIALERDDQVSMNRALRDLGVRWRNPPAGRSLTHAGVSFAATEEPIFGTARDLRLSVLQSTRFPRLVVSVDDAVVAHPLIDRARVTMEEHLRHLGLWIEPRSVERSVAGIVTAKSSGQERRVRSGLIDRWLA